MSNMASFSSAMKGYLLIKDTNIYISAIDLVYFHVVLEGNLFLCVLLRVIE